MSLLLLFLCFALTQPVFDQALKDLVAAKEASVKRIADAALLGYKKRCDADVRDCPRCLPDSCELSDAPADYECSADFGVAENAQCNTALGDDLGKLIQRNASSTRRVGVGGDDVAVDGAARELLCAVHASLDPVFVDNLEQTNGSQKWQFFGDNKGQYTQFPSTLWTPSGAAPAPEACRAYDPRRRPWFVAASTGPKNLVVILDVSGSMRDYNRLSLAKDAVKAVLDTLFVGDFLGIVAFSSASQTRAYKPTLLRATAAAKGNASAFVDTLTAGGATNFEAGLTKAFDIIDATLSDELGNPCNSIILFLTDGERSDGLDGAQLLELVDQKQASLASKFGSRAHLFTFGLGANADTNLPRALSCANEGTYSAVSDAPVGGSGNDLLTQMASYYAALAVGAAKVRAGKVIFSEPYEDANGMGTVISSAVPVYDDTRFPPSLVGVAGVDLTLAEFDYSGDNKVLLDYLIYQSQQCIPLALTYCELSALRDAAECADQTYAGAVAAAAPPTPCPPQETSPTCVGVPAIASSKGMCTRPPAFSFSFAQQFHCCSVSGTGDATATATTTTTHYTTTTTTYRGGGGVYASPVYRDSGSSAAGVVVGVIAGLCLLVLVIVLLTFAMKKAQENNAATAPASTFVAPAGGGGGGSGSGGAARARRQSLRNAGGRDALHRSRQSSADAAALALAQGGAARRRYPSLAGVDMSPSAPPLAPPPRASTDSGSGDSCVVCMSASAVMAFTPCGHLATCAVCANALTSCPICRQRIGGRVRVYEV